MFSAARTPRAAFHCLILSFCLILGIALVSTRATAASGDTKPKDFGTQLPVQLLRGAAQLAGAQSTASIISNETICGAVYDQMPPVAVPDGGGGVIAVWADFRTGDLDIYAQKLSAAGVAQWAQDGVPVCKASGAQSNPRVLSDGAGGAFVVWEDARAGADVNIYAQRINSLGVNLWGNGGVLVCNAANVQRQPVVGPNGLGGVLIAWTDERGADADIYAQRYSASGVAQWTANGVALCTLAGIQQDPAVVTDSQGGAMVVWRDERSGVHVYGQRVNETGAVQWAANGIPICTAAAGIQENPLAVSDGAGGMIVTWADTRGGTYDIYAQRVNSAGAIQWPLDGVVVSAAAGDQKRPRICADGAGGAILTWEDRRGANSDIYAQRMNVGGVPQWAANGVAVCAAANDQTVPSIATDPMGGAIVAWSDARLGATNSDIFVQHVQLNGTTLWTAGGVRACDAAGLQDLPAVVPDGSGGAAVAWRDYRGGPYSDVYGQRFDAGGQLPDQCVPPDTLPDHAAVGTAAAQNYRTFNQGWFFWAGVGVRGNGADYDLEVYDTGSFGLTPYPSCFGLPLAGSYSSYGTDFVMINFNDLRTPPGVYGARAYRYSGAGGDSLEWDGDNQQIPLNTLWGWGPGWGVLDVYDVGLTAGITYTFDLVHNPAADIRVLLFSSYGAPGYYYVVPRSARVMETTGRYGTYTAPSTEYYGIAVVNDNGVQSGYTLTVKTGVVTGVGDQPSAVTGLRGISPNPGKGPIAIRFAMREAGAASFRILDMAGRAVASLPGQTWQPGEWSVSWDGRDAGGHMMSSGIYFVQMNVNDRRVGTSRLALLR